MENKISLVPLALSTSATAHFIASRSKMLFEAPILPTILWLAVATTIIGCSDVLQAPGGVKPNASTDRSDGGSSGGSDDPLPEAYGTSVRDVLRVKTDAARGRHWLLGLDHVRVYDAVTKKLIRQIALPNWMVVRAVCDPDLVLDRSGSALVSSNVQAKLWRIDGNSFEVKAQEISLPGDQEVGFGALAFTADGTLYALSSSTRSLWKINAAMANASMIESYNPPLNACALAPKFLNEFERSRKP
ncbi:MAG: hypothetical protein Q7R45_11435 [Sulfuricaulis sp.]|nr:hypothetical protein [Sulfuricaulis sp.]